MRIELESAIGLIIDIQERLLPAMHAPDELLAANLKLIDGLKLLGVPLMLTEQYPKGLGPTVPVVVEHAGSAPVFSKISFSCMDDPVFSAALAASGRKTVIVCGIESHVCVQQTVIDLIANGYRVVLVADCVASRKTADRDIALRRMEGLGAVPASAESVLFELTRFAGTDTFKAISKLVK